MSDIGYTSRVQDSISISCDSIEAYARDLAWATATQNQDYVLPAGPTTLQLNANFLQIENELYRPFRLQQHKQKEETLVDALRKRGPGHIEIRVLDIDPQYPGGIDPHAVGFLHLAILDCLIQPSPVITKSEWEELNRSHHEVAWHGRQSGLKIPVGGEPVFFHDQGKVYCENLESLATRMDSEANSNFYRESLALQIDKLSDPEKTPSGKHLAALLDDGKEFVELGLEFARDHADSLRTCEPDDQIQSAIEAESERSTANEVV